MMEGKIVVLFSGGIDSTVLISFILNNYSAVEIYPLFINRGQGNYECEKRAIRYFISYFRKKYGSEKISDVFEIKRYIPAKEFKNSVKELSEDERNNIYVLRNSDLINSAIRYALLIKAEYVAIGLTYPTIENINDLNDYLDNVLLSDATPWYIKIKQLEVGMATAYRVSLIAPFIEYRMRKIDVVSLGLKMGLPLGKTCSCFRPVRKKNTWLHCGRCAACKTRRRIFEKLKVKDPTRYAQSES